MELQSQNLLGVDSQSNLIQSPSTSTFLPEEDNSICPLLSSNTPSPPLAFSHPLTSSGGDNDSQNSISNNSVNCEDTKAEETSSSSSGIVMEVTDTAATTLFNKLAYQHLKKNNNENIIQENGKTVNGHLSHLNIPLNKDTPDFVFWNWPVIRKCTFFVFLSSLLAMLAMVIAMIVTLPKSCNPKTAWYRGDVFYEIFPASFQDSNNDGIGDLRGIRSRIDYMEQLGIGAIRLNSIFPSPHYPDDYEKVTDLMNIAQILGSPLEFLDLVNVLHSKNISIILDLPLYPYFKHLDEAVNWNKLLKENLTVSTTTSKPEIDEDSANPITSAIQFWLHFEVDGFYIKGLEHFSKDPNLIDNLAEWKSMLGVDRVLMVSDKFIHSTDALTTQKVMEFIDLIDVHLDVSNGTSKIHSEINEIITGVVAPSEFGPWIHWSLGGVARQRLSRGVSPNITLASILMQLMLPGTPNIFYGDEIALEESHDPHNEHMDTKHLHHLSTMQWNNGVQFTNRESLPWLPKGATATFQNFEEVAKMIKLRELSPAIYKNSIMKENKNLKNTNVRHSLEDILVVERIYPRRNTFVSISNFGNTKVSMDMTSMYYSGHVMVGKTRHEKIYFKEFEIGPMQTIVIKLDK